MQKFDPQLVQVKRNALEEGMTKVPSEYSTSSTKAYLAECILKAAAQGQTSYDQLVAAAADQIDHIQVIRRSSEEDADVGGRFTNSISWLNCPPYPLSSSICAREGRAATSSSAADRLAGATGESNFIFHVRFGSSAGGGAQRWCDRRRAFSIRGRRDGDRT
jgi:hypothetical protein